MESNHIPVLNTPRLTLRKCRLSDAPDIFAFSSVGHLVGPMAGWKPHQTLVETVEIINTVFEKDWVWAVVSKADKKVIGTIGLHRNRTEDGGTELGYALSEMYWGEGLMPEAAQAVLEYAFLRLGLEEVSCSHFPFNDRSRRVIEKLGFRYLTTVRNSFMRYDGQSFDEMRYLITRNDFIAGNEHRTTAMNNGSGRR